MHERCLILCHQGLGDHLACNGLYMTYSSMFERVYLPVTTRYFNEVTRMLGNKKNITLIKLSNSRVYWQQRQISRLFEWFGFETLKLGYFDLNFKSRPQIRLDEYFYIKAGIPLENRWSKFLYERNERRESNVFESFDIAKGEEYIFLHEDRARGFLINRELIKPKLRIIEPHQNQTISIFDYRRIIENASEIHCIESSFSIFIDSIELPEKRLFAHRYSRPEAQNDLRYEFTYKKGWEIYLENSQSKD